MFERTMFFGRMCLGHVEPPGGDLAKIFARLILYVPLSMCPILFYNEPEVIHQEM